MRALALAATGVIVLSVSACGSSSTSTIAATSPAASSPTARGTTPSAPTTTPTSAATTTATQPVASTAPQPCRASDLSLSFLGGQGATGHGELGFGLRNTSSHACTTIGYPGILFLDHGGRALPTLPNHTTQDYFGSIPKMELTVAPGATVSFRLGVTHGMTSTAGCTTAYALQVIPPNDTATLRTAIPNGAYECRTATVSPLAQGTSAYL